MSSHFGANSQGSQISTMMFSHSNANSEGQQIGVVMFSHYGANSQGLQISVGTNANLLASKLTSQGKGCGGGSIGHNIGKLRFFDNDMTIGNITTHSHSFPKNM